MRLIKTFFIMFFFVTNVVGAELDDVFVKFDKIKTIRAEFVQETTIKNFGTDTYSGVVLLKSKDKVLWDYTRPYPQHYFFTKEMMEYYDSSTEQLIRQKVSQSGSNNIIFQILMDLKEAQNAFNFIKNGEKVYKLIPKTEIGLNFILLTLSDSYISIIESEDKNGNKTVIQMKNVEINTPIDDAEFKKEIPLKTEIFNY